MAQWEDDDAPQEDRVVDYEFELMTSDDGLRITLICRASSELSPDEFAQALRDFAHHIESLVSVAEEGAQQH